MFANIPQEVVERILAHATPVCVSCFAQTCRRFRTVVYDTPDNHLWRLIFLNHNDDPRLSITASGNPINDFDWMGEAQRRWRATLPISSETALRKPWAVGEEIGTAVDVALSVIYTAAPRRAGASYMPRFLACVLAMSTFGRDHLEDSGHALPSRLWQLRAHCPCAIRGGTSDDAYHAAVRIVFWQHYRAGATSRRLFWLDRRECVDWEWFAAARAVAEKNGVAGRMQTMPEPFDALRSCYGDTANSTASNDWAGVTGRWKRCVFYRDFHNPLVLIFGPTGSSTPILVASIDVTLWVTGYTTVDEWPHRPVIHVGGTSNAPSGGGVENKTVAGTVRMTPDGHVRWHLVTSVSGQEAWDTEGVQLGNIGSALGVLGAWAHIQASGRRSPGGCFWAWRVE